MFQDNGNVSQKQYSHNPDMPNHTPQEILKNLISKEAREYSENVNEDISFYRFESAIEEQLKGTAHTEKRNLYDIIADDNDESYNEVGAMEERKDYTRSSLLHFAARLGACRSLKKMVSLIRSSKDITPEDQQKLIDRPTHRCYKLDPKTDKDKLDTNETDLGCNLSDDNPHPDNKYSRGGSALLVRRGFSFICLGCMFIHLSFI